MATAVVLTGCDFVSRVIQEKLDRWEREDTRAPQDLPESKVYLEPLGRRGQR